MLGRYGSHLIYVPSSGPPPAGYVKLWDTRLDSWINMAAAGPSMVGTNIEPCMSYPPALATEARASFIVPFDYIHGSPLLLRCRYDTDADALAGNVAKMESRGARIIAGTVLDDPPTFAQESYEEDWVVSPAVQGTVWSPYMYITDANGQINGVDVGEGDEVHVILARNLVGDTVTSNVRVRVGTVEVYQLVGGP